MKRFVWLAPVILSVGCAECDQPFEKQSKDPPGTVQQPQGSGQQGSGKFKHIDVKKPFMAINPVVGAPAASTEASSAPAAASAPASASASASAK